MTALSHTVREWGSFVKFSHTVFALPFALAAMLVAARDSNGWPGWRVFLLVLVAMVSTGFAIVSAAVAIVVADRQATRSDMVAQLEVLAEAVAKNSTSSLLFLDATSAEETLEALRAMPEAAVRQIGLLIVVSGTILVWLAWQLGATLT